MLAQRLDILPSHELAIELAKPVLRSQGLMRAVTEYPAGIAAVDLGFKHTVHKADIKFPIHEDARAILSVRHMVPSLVSTGKHGPIASRVNGLLINAKCNSCNNLSRGLA